MLTANDRNSKFNTLVKFTINDPNNFGARLLELRAFASGAGCALKFDSQGFELWSSESHRARLVCRVEA